MDSRPLGPTLLEGKVAVVTGSSRGIGRAIALTMAAHGADVVISYLQNRRAAEDVAEAVRGLQRRAAVVEANVAIAADVSRLAEAWAEHFGRIDILINNGGSGLSKPYEDFTEADWDFVVDQHLKGTFLTCRAAGPLMREQRSGVIINMSSVAGAHALPFRTAYSAAKAGIEGLTRSLAGEWARYGVRVNALAPGTIATELVTRNIAAGTLDLSGVVERTPLGRFGEPQEVANVALFLASDLASYITGQVIAVDGGWSIWSGWPTAT